MEWGFSYCHWRAQDTFSECIIKTALPKRPSLWSHFLINMGFVIIVSLCWQKCSWRPQAACSWKVSQNKHTLWLLLASDDCSFWICALAASILSLLFQFIAKFFYNSSKDMYSTIGGGLAKFTERGENAKRGVKLPGAELFTNKEFMTSHITFPVSCSLSCFSDYMNHWV